MQRTSGARAIAYGAALIIIAVSVAALSLTPAITAGSAAPVLVLAVLVVARTWGTGPGLVASASAAAGLSYYFLKPVGLARFEDPNDWAALITFTITAIIVGELSARAERRHLEAQAGRQEIERLYQELQGAFDRASEAEAARRNEALKAALLDALTHNLRTPLTAIKASVTALMGAAADADRSSLSAAGRRELLQVIDEESDRLNRFIEGLSVADRTHVADRTGAAAVSVVDIIKDGLARAETVTRYHRVHVDIEEGLPGLPVDAAAMTEVVYILLDNASKYAPAGTDIHVTASHGSESNVRVAIVDEGPGIAPELRERVFEKFFRVPGREASDPRRAAGIGLGLSIARRLVEAQSGRVWIETPVSGRGTAVVLSLPTAVSAANREVAAPLPVAASVS
jgi:two-component system sensor histidine kinase KdpD